MLLKTRFILSGLNKFPLRPLRLDIQIFTLATSNFPPSLAAVPRSSLSDARSPRTPAASSQAELVPPLPPSRARLSPPPVALLARRQIELQVSKSAAK
eukprot:767779-Hanusia_phi.AAC.9